MFPLKYQRSPESCRNVADKIVNNCNCLMAIVLTERRRIRTPAHRRLGF